MTARSLSFASASFTIQWSHPDWDGRWQCTPTDVPLSTLAACDQQECEDTTAPTISAASAGSITHNSAVITITATDNVGVSNYFIKNGNEVIANSFSSPITLNGLTPNTTYNLKVYVEDDCGNTSDTSTVNFTTETFTYCDYPTGHLGNAAFGDANGRILLTIRKISDSSVGVTVKPNGGSEVFDFVSVIIAGVGKDLGAVGGSTPTNTEIEFTGLASLNFTANVLWHNVTMAEAGRWTTNDFNVAEAELCLESPATSIDNTNADAQAVKVIENGQLIIIKNGIRYNALGAQMK